MKTITKENTTIVTDDGLTTKAITPRNILTMKIGELPPPARDLVLTGSVTALLFLGLFIVWGIIAVLTGLFGGLFWLVLFAVVAYFIHPVVKKYTTNT